MEGVDLRSFALFSDLSCRGEMALTLLPSDGEATSKTGSRKMAQAVVCDEKSETRINNNSEKQRRERTGTFVGSSSEESLQ